MRKKSLNNVATKLKKTKQLYNHHDAVCLYGLFGSRVPKLCYSYLFTFPSISQSFKTYTCVSVFVCKVALRTYTSLIKTSVCVHGGRNRCEFNGKVSGAVLACERSCMCVCVRVYACLKEWEKSVC